MNPSWSPSVSESSGLPNRSSHKDHTVPSAPNSPRSQTGERDKWHSRSIIRSRSLQENRPAREGASRIINTAVDTGRFSRLHPSTPQSAISAVSSAPFHTSPRGGRELRASVAQKIPDGTPPPSSPPSPRRRILFYHKHERYYGFTNFSPHSVFYQGQSYPTSEHLFQSFKFTHKPNLAEHIRTCDPRPARAFSEARRFQPEVRSDWKRVNIELMDKVLWHKFNQHRDLKDELLGTGHAELVENSDKDSFWGIGSDGKGRNELGRALERLRTRLRT